MLTICCFFFPPILISSDHTCVLQSRFVCLSATGSSFHAGHTDVQHVPLYIGTPELKMSWDCACLFGVQFIQGGHPKSTAISVAGFGAAVFLGTTHRSRTVKIP